MKKLISCEFNMDTACVELKFTDGSMIAIDTIAVENEVVDNMYQRSELDWLIYNKPLAARTVSMTLKKHADEFGIEHDNHITNRLGKRVNGFWGIEALVTPPIL